MGEILIETRELSPFKQRFADAPWYEAARKEFHVLLLGAGGIGRMENFLYICV